MPQRIQYILLGCAGRTCGGGGQQQVAALHLKQVRYLVWHDSMMFGVTTINANWDVARSAIQRLRDSSSVYSTPTARARNESGARRHYSGLLGWWCANGVAGDVVTCRLLQKRDGVAIAMIVGYNAGVERWVTMWLRWKCGRLLEAWSGPWKLDEDAMQLIDFDDKLGLTKLVMSFRRLTTVQQAAAGAINNCFRFRHCSTTDRTLLCATAPTAPHAEQNFSQNCRWPRTGTTILMRERPTEQIPTSTEKIQTR